jgi:hypothetical protein
MSWGNKVFPVFMGASEEKPGRLPELAFVVQIGITFDRSEST